MKQEASFFYIMMCAMLKNFIRIHLSSYLQIIM
jgi:hypothetical protein